MSTMITMNERDVDLEHPYLDRGEVIDVLRQKVIECNELRSNLTVAQEHVSELERKLAHQTGVIEGIRGQWHIAHT